MKKEWMFRIGKILIAKLYDLGNDNFCVDFGKGKIRDYRRLFGLIYKETTNETNR